MIIINHKGDFNNTRRFFKRFLEARFLKNLNKYGQEGVEALAAATPTDTGKTASSWYYEISRSGSSFSISWANSHVNDGVNIAVIIQLGHGTGTGGYVAGRDYINPAIRPIFDRIAQDIWKEVSAL